MKRLRPQCFVLWFALCGTLALTLIPNANLGFAEKQAGGKGKGADKNAVAVSRGKSATATLPAEAAKKLTSVQVVDDDRPVTGVTATLGKTEPKGRTVTITASKDAPLGKYQLQGSEGKKTVTLGLTVYVGAPKAEVDQLVKARNSKAKSNDAAFAKAGWTSIKPPAFDKGILDLDPNAAVKRKGEFLQHLRTNSFGGKALYKLEQVALKVTDPAVRTAALQAIGESPDPKAQDVLIKLYGSLKDPKARQDILQHLRPRKATDKAANFLAAELGKAPAGMKNDLLRRLVAINLAQRKAPKAPPAALLGKLPTSLRDEFQAVYDKTARGVRLDYPFLKGIKFPTKGPVLDPELTASIKNLKDKMTPGFSFMVMMDSNGHPVTVTEKHLKGSNVRQVFIVPTGYTSAEAELFLTDVHIMLQNMSKAATSTAPNEHFTAKYRNNIVYIVQWLPGKKLDAAGSAVFSAKVFDHPVRGGKGLTLVQTQVFNAVDNFKKKMYPFAPIGVMVIFNTDEQSTANASPPTLLIPAQLNRAVKGYGIVRMTRRDAVNSNFIPMHELAHAAINFLDEYVESILNTTDIRDLDALTPLLVFDSTWSGLAAAVGDLIGQYDLRISEAFAENGFDNISLRRNPPTVGTSNQTYEIDGGAFFGRGTTHDQGNNVMCGFSGPAGSLFGFDHSPSQRQVLKQVFETPSTAGRANDRLRNAGPLQEWLPQWGSKVRVMLFDADRHHRWHPTTKYEVEVSWEETVWETCSEQVFGVTVYYPCPKQVRKAATRQVTPTLRTVDISKCLATGMAGMLQAVLEGVGVTTIEMGSGQVNIAGMTVNQLLTETAPAIRWPMPYQDVEVEAPNALTTYNWRFRAYNGTSWSGWTSPGSFTRAL